MPLPKGTTISETPSPPPPPSLLLSASPPSTFATSTATILANSSPVSSRGSTTPIPSISHLYGQSVLQRRGSDVGLVNYYFVFIAIALLIICLPIWLILRKRARSRVRHLTNRQSALHRDLATSNSTRGWTYGESRTTRLWGEGGGILSLARRGRRNVDEGLDERGEAPPPYKASGEGEVVVAHGGDSRTGNGSSESQEGQEEGHGGVVAIPLRTMAREDIGLKPPDYSEAVAREMHDDGDLGTGSSTGTTSRQEREEGRGER